MVTHKRFKHGGGLAVEVEEVKREIDETYIDPFAKKNPTKDDFRLSPA